VTELTAGDITRAYATIGYTEDHTVLICVSPQESPDEYILTMHKQAMKNAKSPADRSAVSEAITIIGTSRNNEVMKEYGRTGQTMITVEDAYQALSAPMESVDDGLIMWVLVFVVRTLPKLTMPGNTRWL
jgi:ubiquitin carboxyl-terminal hydrolase 25/28